MKKGLDISDMSLLYVCGNILYTLPITTLYFVQLPRSVAQSNLTLRDASSDKSYPMAGIGTKF